MSRRKLSLLLSVLALVGMLACSLPKPRTLTPIPTATPTVGTSATPAPTATAAAAAVPSPTPSPTYSPTPMPPTAPLLLYRRPERGEEQRVDAPLVLTFDQAMDKASVEKAFAIEPAVKGKFKWPDDRVLVFAPEKGWQRESVYRVVVAATARSKAGVPLRDDVSFRFTTTGYLEVTQVQPAPDATDVSTKGTITVMFNRPVVPMVAVGEMENLPDPLVIDPPTEGKGEWLNTSIYVWRPKDGFNPSTTYHVTVKAGLEDTTGGVLADDYEWSFTTKLPRVSWTLPSDGAQYVNPSTTISVTFNQPMDPQSVESRFSLTDEDGNAISGKFYWSGDLTNFVFTPNAPLARAGHFLAKVGWGAKSAVGNRGLQATYMWRFSIADHPRIVNTTPYDGEENFDIYDAVSIRFNSPINPQSLPNNLRVEYYDPEKDEGGVITATQMYSHWANYYTRLYLNFAKRPSAQYTVTLTSGIVGMYGEHIPEGVVIHFTTAPLPPTVYFAMPHGVGMINAYTTTTVLVGYRNISRLDFKLYRIAPEKFESYIRSSTTSAPSDQLVNSWSMSVAPPPNTTRVIRVRVLDEDGKSLKPGFYYLQLSSPDITYGRYRKPPRYLLYVSRVNVLLKRTSSSALVWITDLKSGEPVAGAKVTLRTADKRQKVLGTGTTDAEGLFEATFSDTAMHRGMYALIELDGEYAIGHSWWDDGILPWNFGLSPEYYDTKAKALFYTDRPIYRPGQKVYFKGVIRLDDDAHYSLPTPGDPVVVVIEDSRGREVYNEVLKLSDMGTVNGEFTLDQEAALGYYYLSANYLDAGFYARFRVAEYKKPEFQVDVQTDRDQYIQGDAVNVTAHATYYFGGPVSDAQVHWVVLSRDYFFRWTGPGWYDWHEWDWEAYRPWEEEYSEYGKVIAEGDGRTDADGRFTFSIPADIADKINSQVFTIDVTVTDVNDRQVSNRAQTIVHKGLFYIGLAPHRYVGQVGKENAIDLRVVDIESSPVADQEVQVVFMRRHWYSVRKESGSGRWYWDWTVENIPVYTTTVRTDAQGKASATFTPDKGGSYKVLATATDARGNEIRSATYFWVSSREWISWRRDNDDRIELIADKKEYQVGDTAEILVPSPFKGPIKALLTIERGKIIERRVITIQTNSDIIKIPITEEFVPNAFVSLVLVKGIDESNPFPAFKVGYVALPVSTETKKLNITITPDRDAKAGEHYRPRDKVHYDIQVTDHAGKGVEAELSLDLVDLSVLALTGGARGQSLIDAFYYRRGIGIHTSSSLIVAVERVVAEMPVTAGKGGGGGELGEGMVRTRFADTAYWNPTVRTDANGHATVEVELPDNLTTWRLRGRGVTADTLVGEGTVDVVSTLDLLVRPVAPRFFIVGDQATLGVVVHNNTDGPIKATVTLEATGLQVDQGPQDVTLPAHGKARINWPVSVQNVDEVVLRIGARGGGHSDAMELNIPVYTYSTPEVVATAGQLRTAGERLEAVILPPNFDPNQGELTIQTDPSLAAGMVDGLRYLKQYPYGCTEQVVSRWLPNVLTYKALRDLGISNPKLEEKLPDLVRSGLQVIYKRQHYDGGWGWWTMDQSNPFLTAYVLFGLVKADEAGFDVDRGVVDNAIGYLQSKINIGNPRSVKEQYRLNRQAFILYVLAEADSGDLSRAVSLMEVRDRLSNYAKAYLALALALTDSADSARVKTLLSDLNSAAILSATGAHWEENWVDYWAMNTDVRSTTIIIDALSRLDPRNDLLPNAVRWLMAARKSGHWETTQETAWALIALTDYMVMTGELEADYTYTISLNGELLEERDITKQDVRKSFKVTVPIADLLAQEVNRVLISRQEPTGGQTGKGTLYYALYLRYFLPAKDIKPLSRGIILARQYLPADCNPDKETCKPLREVRVGDVVKVKITLVAPHNLHYLVLEDPLPAGFEAIDRSLKTTSVASSAPSFLDKSQRYGWGRGWGWWWFTYSEVRDEKVALFANYLRRGTYEYTYYIRASVPGQFQTMPAVAYEMYFPEVWGRSDGLQFTVLGE